MCVCKNIHILQNKNVYTHLYACLFIYIYLYAYIYIHIYMCAYMHIHINKHKYMSQGGGFSDNIFIVLINSPAMYRKQIDVYSLKSSCVVYQRIKHSIQ